MWAYVCAITVDVGGDDDDDAENEKRMYSYVDVTAPVLLARTLPQ